MGQEWTGIFSTGRGATILDPATNFEVRQRALYDRGMYLYYDIKPQAGSELSEENAKRVAAPRTAADYTAARRMRGPIQPRFRNYHTDQFAAAGAIAERFTVPVTVPVDVGGVTLNINNGDASNSHIHLLIRRGTDTTAGLLDDDLEFFTNPDPTAGIGSLMSASTGGGTGFFPVGQPMLDTPFLFHVRAVNVAGATPLHFNVVFHCRIIDPDELNDYESAPLLEALRWGGPRGHAGQPARRLPPAGIAPEPPLMQVCSLGFCRKIPFTFLAKPLQKEYLVNQINGVPTPGMTAIT